jgi:DNA-binding FadR family transcriptional regulator
VNARFHEVLVALAGNRTMTVLVEMLNEVVTRAVDAVSRSDQADSVAVRRRGVRSQAKLADLIEAGDADAAEAHWRTHMTVVGRVLLGQEAKTVVDLLDDF